MKQVLIKTILELPQKVYAAINENLKPNPKYTPTPLQQEIAHKRNKAFFTILFLYQFLFIYDIVINNGSLTKNLISLATIYFIYFVLFISCRYHPQIFNCYYGLICLSFGPSTMDGGPESIAHAFMATNFISLIVQVVTGSYTHYILQAIGQAVLLNTVYQKPLEEMIFSNTPERVLHYFTHAANFMLLLQAFVVVLIHRFLAQTQQQALVLEQRKNEAETQKTFLLSFSHELRNLINSLTGNVKLASLENIGGRAKDFLLNAEVCGELLLHLINNILDTGKVAIGELEIHPVSTNTYDTFERIWGICSELIRRKDLKGLMKIPRNLPRTIMIDPHRLTQIFLNLVGNSIKFTDKGSIDLTIEWLPNRNIVNERCFQPYPFNNSDEQDEGLFEKQERFTLLDEEYSVLTTSTRKLDARQLLPAIATRKGVLKMIVTDKGCGMSQEQTEKLFQKFMQVTTDATKKKLGTGLGLYITKQLCQRMEGEIRVFSQKDKGSSFVFCIPVDVVFENNHLINNHESLKSRLLAKSLRAMIVDDIPSNHIILKTFFENLGIQVSDIALNGFEAYQKYSDDAALTNCPQIIAMDLDMPIMNGKEASQKIREFEAKNELSPAFLLIISGNCLESEIAECLNKEGRIRADAFLRKPLKIEDLTRVVISHFIKD